MLLRDVCFNFDELNWLNLELTTSKSLVHCEEFVHCLGFVCLTHLVPLNFSHFDGSTPHHWANVNVPFLRGIFRVASVPKRQRSKGESRPPTAMSWEPQVELGRFPSGRPDGSPVRNGGVLKWGSESFHFFEIFDSTAALWGSLMTLRNTPFVSICGL